MSVVLVLACGPKAQAPITNAEPAPAETHHAPPLREDQHPCDDFTQVRVETKTVADAVVFEEHVSSGHCSTPRTTVKELGRISTAKRASCPIGELAYRAWSGSQGFHVELPAVDQAIASEPRAELRQALGLLATNGVVTAYVLGCGASTDFVVAAVDHDVRLQFWVRSKWSSSDARFTH